jgi:hypothetical protein
MGHHRHPSRREILNSIAVLGGGSLLVPLTLLGGQKPDTRMPAVIKGKLTDTMGNPVPAKVRVTLFDGSEPFFPEHAIRTMPKKGGRAPPIGPNWVQFDLRFYVIALVYLVFDVELALFYPWAVAYGANPENRPVALVDMLFFFGVLMVGFAYLWRFGYLDWVRSAATTSVRATYRPGFDLGQEARVDRPI